MIKLERPEKVPRPLLTDAAKRVRAEAEEWASAIARASASKTSQQVRVRPTDLLWAPEVAESLVKAQFGKCAFCESPAELVFTGHVDLFRPHSSSVDSNGEPSLPHYAWLSVEWHNLHLICAICNRFRGMRFPVEGRRAPVGTPWASLTDHEHALLLDPFVDDPDDHLIFSADGRVTSRTSEGLATINTFGLNRDGLPEGRQQAATEALQAWREGEVEDAVAAHHLYAAARRQAVRELNEEPPIRSDAVTETDSHLVVGDVTIRKVSSGEKREAKSAARRAAKQQVSYSLEDPSAAGSYFATTKYVQAVEVTNWKAIEHVRIELPVGLSQRAPWFTMLGENGAGKSSLLQAITLALLGERTRDALELQPEEFIRNGARRAEVKVWLTGIPEPCVVTARRGEPRFGGSSDPKVLVLAYGATRLLPRPGGPSAPDDTVDIADADNLFDPFVPMTDANQWLLGLPDAQFDAAARALRELLDLHGTDVMMRYRKAGEVRCRHLGAVVPLDRMSDGYQSVVATTCDIMAVLMSRWADMPAAEGIVLIDELGAHLHPRWRMRVVSALRTVFPRVQFLATTHDPLCLRGLEDGEVAVVERLADDDATVVVRQELPPIAGLRADQLLTSELFGLRSTIDPDLEKAFNEYYALLALRGPTRAQKRRIGTLRDRLDHLRLMGDTVRERLVFESADKVLATRDALAPATSIRESNDAAVATLAVVWATVAPERFVDRGK